MDRDAQKRILIVDDSKDIQGLLMLLLESKGYAVECTSSGLDAANLLSCSDSLPDVILLDLRMPVMDGPDFLKLQESDSQLKNIPTVVMTGDDDLGSLNSNIEILKKPLNMKSVLAVVEEVCAKSSYDSSASGMIHA